VRRVRHQARVDGNQNQHVTRAIHVVVVAFHAPEQLERCLAGLGRQLRATVVDNSSSDAVRVVATRWSAEYIDAGENRGFAAAVNCALRPLLNGRRRDVLLLNPDAVIEPAEVRKLSRCLDRAREKRLAIVAPRLFDTDGAELRVTWPFPTPLRCWAEAIGVSRLGVRESNTFVIGAVVLLSWEALQEIGLFDERFFLYAEETDWQRRARAAGFRSSLCTGAVAFHAGGGTATDARTREALFHAGQETYIRKWYGAAGWWAYRSAACAGAIGRAIALTGQRRAQAARRALLYARGPRRAAGLAPGPLE
jgi:GT2 family glycosyltransferase